MAMLGQVQMVLVVGISPGIRRSIVAILGQVLDDNSNGGFSQITGDFPWF